MAAPTIVLITGAGRGIGLAIITAYLSRPNHTLIGSVRDTKGAQAEKLKALPKADGSKLLLVGIENTSTTDPKKAVEAIQAEGVDHIDIVISNSGVSPPATPLDLLDPRAITETFNVNAVSTIALFQAVKELLTKSNSPKWISVSSRLGSVGSALDLYYNVSAYGISKAAQNWFTSALHSSIESLIAFAVNPGFVSTDMGNAAAIAAGIDMPPTSPEESATKLLETIDSATRATTSGKLIDVITGEVIPW